LGKPDQAMGVEGVRRSLDPVEGEGDSFRCPDRLHLGVEAHRPLPASELGSAIFLPVHASFGHVRVQLEWMPLDLHILLPSADGDGLLQPSLPDVAPRANHVRDHVYVQRHDRLSFMKIWIRTFLPVS
jgi:hypothetical protein